jgi:hypothetical protein
LRTPYVFCYNTKIHFFDILSLSDLPVNPRFSRGDWQGLTFAETVGISSDCELLEVYGKKIFHEKLWNSNFHDSGMQISCDIYPEVPEKGILFFHGYNYSPHDDILAEDENYQGWNGGDKKGSENHSLSAVLLEFEMDEIFSSCPNFQEKLFFHPGESFTLSAGNHLEMPVGCISTFTLNPLLAEYTDMVRIADMYTTRLTAHETMLHRAALYRIAQPQAVIDTDGQLSHYTLDDYSSELAEQAKLGVPSLYAAELVIRGRFFLPQRVTKMTKEDYRVFAKVFARHRKKLKTQEIETSK